MVQVKRDLTGEKFGRLTVIEQSEDWIIPTTQVHIPMWHCKCKCGKELNVRGNDLKNGTTSSCGCYKRDIHIKPNKYDLSGEYGIGYNASDNREFYFDLEDYDKIKNRAWYEYQGYIKTVVNGQNILLHRLVMGIVGKNGIVDHINRCRTDCRKNNLRIVDIATNNQNRARYRQDGSKVGVYQVGKNKWKATIGLNSKCVALGIFNTYDKAVKVRVEAEHKYYGDNEN